MEGEAFFLRALSAPAAAQTVPSTFGAEPKVEAPAHTQSTNPHSGAPDALEAQTSRMEGDAGIMRAASAHTQSTNRSAHTQSTNAHSGAGSELLEEARGALAKLVNQTP